jgi:hypothetical protein
VATVKRMIETLKTLPEDAEIQFLPDNIGQAKLLNTSDEIIAHLIFDTIGITVFNKNFAVALPKENGESP